MNPYTDISRGVEKISISADPDISFIDFTDFVYVRHNIPGPGAPASLFEDVFEGCRCENAASCDDGCACIARFGPAYDDAGRLTDVDPCSETMRPIYECNRSCRCAPSCRNRVVQRGVAARLAVFATEKKGLGLRCLEDVAKDAFVCEYAGELISLDVARGRTKSRRAGDPNYVLAAAEHAAGGAVAVTYVDPTFIGNVGRFINHSCEPNLYMVPVRVDHDAPHLALFAVRDIEAGEELTHDYSGRVRETDADTTEVQRLEANSVDSERTECHCGSASCRLFLPFEKSLYAV